MTARPFTARAGTHDPTVLIIDMFDRPLHIPTKGNPAEARAVAADWDYFLEEQWRLLGDAFRQEMSRNKEAAADTMDLFVKHLQKNGVSGGTINKSLQAMRREASGKS